MEGDKKMGEASNKMTVDMGILTSSKDKVLKLYYDRLIQSPLDIRAIYKRLSKKNISRDNLWGIIAMIGKGDLSEEEFKILEDWIELGEKYLDERGMESLYIHISRAVIKYQIHKGLLKESIYDSMGEILDTDDFKDYDFEDCIKKFEVNSIVLKGNGKLYHVCYINDKLHLCDRFQSEKTPIKGIVLGFDKMRQITEDNGELEDKSLYKIV